MDKQIQITVLNKIAVKTCDTVYVCGNSDFSVHFTFDEDWAAHHTKTARFIANDGTYVDEPFSGDTCPVPILKNTYGFNVGVYAGDLSTTTPAYCPAKKSILCPGGLPKDPEPDVYNKIMEKMNDGSLKGETGPQGPAGPQGIPGADGFSPTLTVTQTEGGATITATDKNGTTTANIEHGKGSDFDTPTDLEIIGALIEADLLLAVTDSDGAILADKNGILVM